MSFFFFVNKLQLTAINLLSIFNGVCNNPSSTLNVEGELNKKS